MRAEDAMKLSTDNRAVIRLGTVCGCYYCRSNFTGEVIREWIGDTAICPKCGVDSVVPGATDKNFLEAANKLWFGRRHD